MHPADTIFDAAADDIDQCIQIWLNVVDVKAYEGGLLRGRMRWDCVKEDCTHFPRSCGVHYPTADAAAQVEHTLWSCGHMCKALVA